jgi:hypothetical protein
MRQVKVAASRRPFCILSTSHRMIYVTPRFQTYETYWMRGITGTVFRYYTQVSGQLRAPVALSRWEDIQISTEQKVGWDPGST